MRNIYFALIIAIIVIAWMAIGYTNPENVKDNNTVSEEKAHEKNPDSSPISVEIEIHHVKPIAETLEVSGYTEPNRVLELRSELSGKIENIPVHEGDEIKKDTLITSLDLRDREIQLQKALAVLSEQKNAYERTKRMVNSNLQSQNTIDQALSLYKSAQADVKRLRLELARTEISAPFDGLLENLNIEIGTFVEAGSKIATIIDINPLIVRVDIPQHDYARVKLGQTANVTTSDGKIRKGKIRYLSSMANTNTRAFRTEIEIDNKDGSLPAGLSAKAAIETEIKNAHFVSPSVLSLDSEGRLGIKTVNDNDKVEFHRIEIINSEPSGVWVSGLPETARIITVGQGFVREGTKVIAKVHDIESPPVNDNESVQDITELHSVKSESEAAL